ncbi:DUF6882 domain-containing protein [Gulosibacter chungangensis]
MSLFTHVHAETEMTALTLDSQWQVDLPAASVTFATAYGNFTYPIQLIGSIAHAAGTWMWGWQEDNIERFPTQALRLAQAVLDKGLAVGIPELATPVITLSETPSLVLRLAAQTIGQVSHTLTVDAGRGLSLVFAVDMGQLRPLSSHDLVEVAMQATDLGVTDNHLDALECYARRNGFDYLVTSHDPLTAMVGSPAGGIEIESDEGGRFIGLRERTLQVQRQAS